MLVGRSRYNAKKRKTGAYAASAPLHLQIIKAEAALFILRMQKPKMGPDLVFLASEGADAYTDVR